MKGVCRGENLSKPNERLHGVQSRLLENQEAHFILHSSFFILHSSFFIPVKVGKRHQPVGSNDARVGTMNNRMNRRLCNLLPITRLFI
jgi:hypothetical protein